MIGPSLFVCGVLFAGIADVSCTEDRAGFLKNYLLEGYEKDVAPNFTNVDIDIAVRRIAGIDRMKQILTMDAWLLMQWTDERIAWSPDQFSGMSRLAVPSSKIWIPDITLFNSDDGFTTFNKDTRLTIFNSGHVIFVPPMKFNSYCSVAEFASGINETLHCTLKMGSWVYSGDQLNLNTTQGWMFDDYFEGSNHWQISNASHTRSVMKYECCEEEYIAINFHVELKSTTWN